MDTIKTVYWSTTSFVALMMVISACTYFFHQGTIEGIQELGFPNYFRIELAIVKLIGAIVVLVPQASIQMKEWAYAGIGLFCITAIVAHTAHGDPVFISLISVALLALLIVSNIYLHKMTSR